MSLQSFYQNHFGSFECRGCGDTVPGKKVPHFLADASCVCSKCDANGVLAEAFVDDLDVEEVEEIAECMGVDLDEVSNVQPVCMGCGVEMRESQGRCGEDSDDYYLCYECEVGWDGD